MLQSLQLVVTVVSFKTEMTSTILNTMINLSVFQLVIMVVPFNSGMASTILNTMIHLSFFQLAIMVVPFKSKMASTIYFTLPCLLTRGTFLLYLSNKQPAFKQQQPAFKQYFCANCFNL